MDSGNLHRDRDKLRCPETSSVGLFLVLRPVNFFCVLGLLFSCAIIIMFSYCFYITPLMSFTGCYTEDEPVRDMFSYNIIIK